MSFYKISELYQPLMVAIDGEAASGKGSIANFLGHQFNLIYLDTGKLYRLAGILLEHYPQGAWIKELNKHNLISMIQCTSVDLNNEKTAKLASHIAIYSPIRQNINTQIQKFIQHHSFQEKQGLVLDGRDIGTVILPKAPIKMYITATTEVRAQRRFKELKIKYPHILFDHVLKTIQNRDNQDKKRQADPLKKALDAKLLDTTYLSLDETYKIAYNIVINYVSKNL